MAWATKYQFRFNSVHGVEYRILIKKDGYDGPLILRSLGRAPVLKKKQNGPICGTSLELFAQCDVNGEFAELYTSNPKEYKVELYRASSVLIWTGFVSTELYSEPSIAPPYDVQIIATDGLGELKLNNFSAMGEASLKAILMELLSYTGSSRSFYFATNLKHTGGSRQLTLSWTINIDFLDGKTCYEVLSQILETLHATITTYNGNWLIARETDIATLLNSAGGLSVVFCSSSGTVSTTTLANIRKTVGKMGVANIWPNGNLTTAIEPARNSLVVKAPWHLKDAFQWGDLKESTSAQHWSKDNWQTLDSQDLQWKDSTHHSSVGYYVGDCLVGNDNNGYISYSISVANINGISFKLFAQVYSGIAYDVNLWRLQSGRIFIYLQYTDTTGTIYWSPNKGWGGLTVEQTDLGPVANYHQVREIDYSVPPCIRNTTSGTLTFFISGKDFVVEKANIELTRPESGYQDTIHISNGARGAADAVELLSSRALSDNIPEPSFYQGLWKYSGSVLYSFADSNNTGKDFMSLQALDRAISVALTRTKTEGVIDFPSSLTNLPLIIRQGQQDSWVKTWEWDLLNEDVKISALSLPNAVISIESEDIEPIDNSSSSSSGGTSYGGNSGSSSNGGASLLRVWQSLTNNGELTDYDAATKIAAEHLAQLFTEVIVSSSSKYLKLNTDYDGLASDGFITAGASASASDARLKEKIRTIQPEKALMILAALRGCEWVWNDKYQSLAGQRGSGLIAQEVQSIMPWAVLNFNDELSLNYNSFWGIAIPVMQSQQKHIEKLERMVNQLEKTVEELKNELKKCR